MHHTTAPPALPSPVFLFRNPSWGFELRTRHYPAWAKSFAQGTFGSLKRARTKMRKVFRQNFTKKVPCREIFAEYRENCFRETKNVFSPISGHNRVFIYVLQ